MVRRKSPTPVAIRDDDWTAAIKKNKLFIYKKGAMMPSFIFEKREATRYWEGHGVVCQSVPEAVAWARSQKEPRK